MAFCKLLHFPNFCASNATVRTGFQPSILSKDILDFQIPQWQRADKVLTFVLCSVWLLYRGNVKKINLLLRFLSKLWICPCIKRAIAVESLRWKPIHGIWRHVEWVQQAGNFFFFISSLPLLPQCILQGSVTHNFSKWFTTFQMETSPYMWHIKQLMFYKFQAEWS